MMVRGHDEHFPEVRRQIVLGAEIVDDLSDLPMLRHGAEVALHQAARGFLREAQRLFDRGAVVRLHLLEDRLLLVLVEILDERDRVVGLHLAREVGDLLRLHLVDQVLADIVVELGEHVRADDPRQRLDQVSALIEDLDEDEQQAVLEKMEPDDRAAVEEALSFPEESAGRLMQRDLCAVPEHWKVGQVIDYLRSEDDLPTDFWEVFVVSPDHHPVGTCKLSTILRSPRTVPVSEIMAREQTLIPVDMDQEDVALRFQKYALVSAAVVDGSGRLVGMITVDDIIHIIQEEASEDVLLLSGAGDDGDINEPVGESYRARVRWLIANLLTALVAAFVISHFEESIERLAILAVLMPIVAGFAGVLVPLTLERAGADPAVASSVFVTMITDSMGFLLFLGLATAVGLVR